MSYRGRAVLSVVGLSALGCAAPALELPQARADLSALELEPAAEATAIPLGFRGRVRGAPPGEAWLLRGELSDYHDRAVRRSELPQTLLERAVPLGYWREGADRMVQPLQWLEPGADYVLALSGYGGVAALRTTEEEVPRASRYFPTGAEPAGAAVWCGAGFSPALPALAVAEPGAVPLRITRGVFGSARDECVTLVPEQKPPEPAYAPIELAGVLLEPTLLGGGGEAAQHPEPDCAGEQPLGGACLRVEDDRVLVRTAGSPSLWLLSAPRAGVLAMKAFERATLLEGLEPASAYELTGKVVHASGEVVPFAVPITTQPQRRHLVISEVLANAVGAEPDSEWIEVVNDSARKVSLGGSWLEDAGGGVRLPDVELAAGEVVLLIGAGYRPSALDVPTAPGARLISLPSLGARGLANSGEPLMLVGREGVLSRFPALSAGHAGRSLARRSLASADDDAQGFAEHGPPGASPGAPNSFE